MVTDLAEPTTKVPSKRGANEMKPSHLEESWKDLRLEGPDSAEGMVKHGVKSRNL